MKRFRLYIFAFVMSFCTSTTVSLVIVYLGNNENHFFSSFILHDINLIKNSFEYPYQELLIYKFIFISIIPLIGIAIPINIYFKLQNIYFSLFTTIILIVFILYFVLKRFSHNRRRQNQLEKCAVKVIFQAARHQ